MSFGDGLGRLRARRSAPVTGAGPATPSYRAEGCTQCGTPRAGQRLEPDGHRRLRALAGSLLASPAIAPRVALRPLGPRADRGARRKRCHRPPVRAGHPDLCPGGLRNPPRRRIGLRGTARSGRRLRRPGRRTTVCCSTREYAPVVVTVGRGLGRGRHVSYERTFANECVKNAGNARRRLHVLITGPPGPYGVTGASLLGSASAAMTDPAVPHRERRTEWGPSAALPQARTVNPQPSARHPSGRPGAVAGVAPGEAPATATGAQRDPEAVGRHRRPVLPAPPLHRPSTSIGPLRRWTFDRRAAPGRARGVRSRVRHGRPHQLLPRCRTGTAAAALPCSQRSRAAHQARTRSAAAGSRGGLRTRLTQQPDGPPGVAERRLHQQQSTPARTQEGGHLPADPVQGTSRPS